tara:strand:- start:106 stop:345 length:240 start_codon:yes stop_codon:yes gene_type:complete
MATAIQLLLTVQSEPISHITGRIHVIQHQQEHTFPAQAKQVLPTVQSEPIKVLQDRPLVMMQMQVTMFHQQVNPLKLLA